MSMVLVGMVTILIGTTLVISLLPYFELAVSPIIYTYHYEPNLGFIAHYELFAMRDPLIMRLIA